MPRIIRVDLTACEDWSEADIPYRDAVARALRGTYPDADIEVTIGNVSSMHVWGTYDGDYVDRNVWDMAQAVWNEMCADPASFGV